MWILKNSKDMLEYIQSRSLSSCNSVKHLTHLISTQLFPTLRWRIDLCNWSNFGFMKKIRKNCQRRNKYLVLVRDRSYFVKKNKHSDSTKKFSETDIINMLEFLIDYITNLWVQTVLLFSLTCSFIRMRPTSYRGFSRKEASPILCIPLYRWCPFTK